MSKFGHAVLHKFPTQMTNEEWVRERSAYLGASEVSTILGINRFKTPVEVWASKTGRVEPKFERFYAAERGHLLEELLLQECAIERSLDLDPAVKDYRLQHPDYEWACCNLDGWDRMKQVPVEAKTSSSWHKDHWALLADENVVKINTGVERYYLQIQWQMWVTSASHGWIAVDCDSKYQSIYVARNDEVLNKLVKFATQWWEKCVVGDYPPHYRMSPYVREIRKSYPQT